MGLFDFYQPVPVLRCPACAMPLEGWQGREGPCLLLVWQQGQAAPVAHRVDEESRLAQADLARFRLPDEFHIYTDGCRCRRMIWARGRCIGGTWSESEPITPANARAGPGESDREFRARLRELEAWLAEA